jgi:hypothetical protein
MFCGFAPNERIIDEWVSGGEEFRLVDCGAGPKSLRVLRGGIWVEESGHYVHGVLCNRIEHYAGGHTNKRRRLSDQ